MTAPPQSWGPALWHSGRMQTPRCRSGCRSAPGPHVVRAACPHDCPDTCAMLVTVEQGKVIRIQGDPDHPTTHGALCTKVSRYAERTYHDERVLTR